MSDITTATVTFRVPITVLAVIGRYYGEQGVLPRSRASLVRNALTDLSVLLVEHGKVPSFENEDLAFACLNQLGIGTRERQVGNRLTGELLNE